MVTFWQFQQKDSYASKFDHQEFDPDEQSHGRYPLSMSFSRV
jgi:hypothetical protein